jgi:hydroxymethylbilane synthase
MPVTRPILIASRGSALALVQANQILQQCRQLMTDWPFELKIIKTTGDKLQTASLANANLPKGLFTKELEVALLNGEADLAVHSLKDLPTELPEGLKLGAVGRRVDVRDVLIRRRNDLGPADSQGGSPNGLTIGSLPDGATLATSSTRRAAQLLALRPDLKTVPIRGNVGTRLKKLAEQPGLDGLILALAGLSRLSYRLEPEGRLAGPDLPDGLAGAPIPLGEMLPCVGQAALGIEVRSEDKRIDVVCAKLDHEETRRCVLAERAFLRAMGGGCQLAVAALAEMVSGRIYMRAVSFLGEIPKRAEGSAEAEGAEALGVELAARLAP